MKMPQIRGMAKRLGVTNTVGMTKTELVRKIQTTEGNFACFRTAEKTCDQKNCLWLDDCVGKAAEVCAQKAAATCPRAKRRTRCAT